MQIAKRYNDQLSRIKQNIEKSYNYFLPNYKRYHEFKKFVFESSLSEKEIELAKELQKPQLQFNLMEAFVSRLRGEFSKQEPSYQVSPAEGQPIDPGITPIVEGHLRAILADANKNSFEYETYTDLLAGGFSVIRVYTDYIHERSNKQSIYIDRVYDPTLCGFDIIAKTSHKGDGQYCFETYPKTVDEFRDEFGTGYNIDSIKYSKSIEGFNWSYNLANEDILLVGNYYEKKKRKAKLVALSNNQTMTQDEYEEFLEKWRSAGIIEQPPIPIGKPRDTSITTICRYQVIDNQVIDYTETDYKFLPLIFVDGNSVLIRDSVNGSVRQVCRPYVYHTKDTQRLINYAGQTLANELENQVQHKWKVAKESIPPEYTDAYTNNQVPNVLIYNAYQDNEQEKPLPPPQEIIRPAAPPEIMNTFMTGSTLMQSILGSYDASLGINNNQLSGVAIVEGATQSNSSAMPYVVGFLQGLNQAAQVILDLIPKYYTTPRSIPIVLPNGKKSFVPINQQGGVFLNYDDNALRVNVEAGVNFAIQKSRALQQIIALCQASQLFAQFINQMGLEILLDNLEIRGIDQLKTLAQQFMNNLQKQQQMQQQQMQMQMQQPNPLVMKEQLAQAKFQHQMQQDQSENQFRTAEIMNDANANTNDRMKIMLEQQQAGMDDSVQMQKAKAETYSNAVQLALQADSQRHQQHMDKTNQLHQHTKDALELAHQFMTSDQSQQGNNNA